MTAPIGINYVETTKHVLSTAIMNAHSNSRYHRVKSECVAHNLRLISITIWILRVRHSARVCVGVCMRNCHNMTNFNFKFDNYLDYSTLCVYVFMLVYRMNRIEFGIWTERNEKKGITKYNLHFSTSVGNVWPWKKLELCEKKNRGKGQK